MANPSSDFCVKFSFVQESISIEYYNKLNVYIFTTIPSSLVHILEIFESRKRFSGWLNLCSQKIELVQFAHHTVLH